MTAHRPDDGELLEAVARVWRMADPPPPDLAEGVLARLAADDLELELLTLVESEDLAGIRSEAIDESGTWSLEYAGPDFRLHLRRTRLEDGMRLDGWVVPQQALTVELKPDRGAAQRTEADEHGRFAFDDVGQGQHRLSLRADSGRPLLTPPFWI